MAVFKRLSQAGFDDRKELQCDGITILVPRPRRKSQGSSSGSRIEYDSDRLQFKIEDKRLTFNSQDYGMLVSGDIVDLRQEGIVIVNQLERNPIEKSTAP